MQEQITAVQAITEQMRMEFVDTEGLSTPLTAEFEYDPADPFAVSILFADEPTPVRWTFVVSCSSRASTSPPATATSTSGRA